MKLLQIYQQFLDEKIDETDKILEWLYAKRDLAISLIVDYERLQESLTAKSANLSKDSNDYDAFLLYKLNNDLLTENHTTIEDD